MISELQRQHSRGEYNYVAGSLFKFIIWLDCFKKEIMN